MHPANNFGSVPHDGDAECGEAVILECRGLVVVDVRAVLADHLVDEEKYIKLILIF